MRRLLRAVEAVYAGISSLYSALNHTIGRRHASCSGKIDCDFADASALECLL